MFFWEVMWRLCRTNLPVCRNLHYVNMTQKNSPFALWYITLRLIYSNVFGCSSGDNRCHHNVINALHTKWIIKRATRKIHVWSLMTFKTKYLPNPNLTGFGFFLQEKPAIFHSSSWHMSVVKGSGLWHCRGGRKQLFLVESKGDKDEWKN